VSTAKALERPSNSCHSGVRSASSTAKRAGLEPAAGAVEPLELGLGKVVTGTEAIVADRRLGNAKTQDRLSLLKVEMRLR
jgi:hypothetical protein